MDVASQTLETRAHRRAIVAGDIFFGGWHLQLIFLPAVFDVPATTVVEEQVATVRGARERHQRRDMLAVRP